MLQSARLSSFCTGRGKRSTPRRLRRWRHQTQRLFYSLLKYKMTDRQTDKSQNWAVTAFNNDMLLLEDAKLWPSYVKKVYGGRETCPDTGREHFQGHIQLATQQRMSALKKWLPTAHLEIARNFKASVAYAMKAETSSGEKNEVINPKPFIDNETALMMLARVEVPDDIEWQTDKSFWFRVRHILRQDTHLCGLFAKPDIYRLWKHTWEVWIEKSTEEPIVLQAPTIISSESIDGKVREGEEDQQGQEDAPGEEASG